MITVIIRWLFKIVYMYAFCVEASIQKNPPQFAIFGTNVKIVGS